MVWRIEEIYNNGYYRGESQYTKEISKLKDEWHEKEVLLLERNGSLLKEGVEKDKQIYENEKEIEILSNMNYWEFRK